MMRTLLERELPDYAAWLLSDVAVRTGYPLVVVEKEGIGYDSLVSMAGRTQPFHELSYVPLYRQYRLHFIVNAAVKIRRVWDIPPEERLLPVGEAGKRLPQKQEAELRRKLGNPPPAVLAGLSSFLYEGTVRQLTSMPVDIRVERETAELVPEHMSAQHAYLARQVKDLEPHFMPQIAEFAPDQIYAASTAMNVVLAEEAADIAGVQPGPMFRQTRYRALGERLRELLHAVEESGYPGDRVVTDGWAHELNLRDWYEWRRLDEVR